MKGVYILAVCKTRANLDKFGERLQQQQVGELIRGVHKAEQGIDVVILQEITASGAQNIDGSGKQLCRLGFSGYPLHLRLVFLVVSQLLR